MTRMRTFCSEELQPSAADKDDVLDAALLVEHVMALCIGSLVTNTYNIRYDSQKSKGQCQWHVA